MGETPGVSSSVFRFLWAGGETTSDTWLTIFSTPFFTPSPINLKTPEIRDSSVPSLSGLSHLDALLPWQPALAVRRMPRDGERVPSSSIVESWVDECLSLLWMLLEVKFAIPGITSAPWWVGLCLFTLQEPSPPLPLFLLLYWLGGVLPGMLSPPPFLVFSVSFLAILS